jgi:NDP-sugar pyrophosphorylase family protein
MISGRPFLDILVEDLVAQGLRRIVLCAGHGADQIADHFQQRMEAEYILSIEPQPLGTAGALRHALPRIHTQRVVVVNGDSFCRVDYSKLLADHAAQRPAATIVVTPPAARTDTGTVEVDEAGGVVSFNEKPGLRTPHGGYVNAGVYVLDRALIASQPPDKLLSLEREIFPALAQTGRCRAFRVAGPLIDIGTPERYAAAQGQLR